MEVHFLHKDQLWDTEETVYWFSLSGFHQKTWFFGDVVYGIVESGPCVRVVDDEFYDIGNESLANIIKSLATVNDKMRAA